MACLCWVGVARADKDVAVAVPGCRTDVAAPCEAGLTDFRHCRSGCVAVGHDRLIVAV